MKIRRLITGLIRCAIRACTLFCVLLGALVIVGYFRSAHTRDGFLYGRAGGTFITFSTDGQGRGKFTLSHPWPVAVPFHYVNDGAFIGFSGALGGTDYFHSYPQFGNSLIEKGTDFPYVAPDGITPLLNSLASLGGLPTTRSPIHFFLMLFPLQYLIAVCAIVPALHAGAFAISLFLRARRRRRQQRDLNLCPVCRYNLFAHKPGEKCPECGTTITNV